MSEHYFSRTTQTTSAPRFIHFDFRGEPFSLQTDRAVFSKNGPDRGSLVLLEGLANHFENTPPRPGARFLDFAAGYGLIGLVLARFFPSLEFSFSEINERALELCRCNAERSGLRTARITASDGAEALRGRRFDFITLNPPIRTGKETVRRLLAEAGELLAEEGELYTVIGKKQGAESYARFLCEHYHSERVYTDKGFELRRNRLLEKGRNPL